MPHNLGETETLLYHLFHILFPLQIYPKLNIKVESLRLAELSEHGGASRIASSELKKHCNFFFYSLKLGNQNITNEQV